MRGTDSRWMNEIPKCSWAGGRGREEYGWTHHFLYSSVIRQKGKSQNGDNKKTKQAKYPEKRTFLTAWYALSGGKNVRFSENLACFVFL